MLTTRHQNKMVYAQQILLVMCIFFASMLHMLDAQTTFHERNAIVKIPNSRLVYEKTETQLIAEDDQANFFFQLKPSEHPAGKVSIRIVVCKGKISSILDDENSDEEVIEDGYIFKYYEWNGKKEERVTILVKSHEGPAEIHIVWTISTKFDPIALYLTEKEDKTISYLEGGNKNVTIMWQVPIADSNAAYQYYIYKKLRSNNCPMVKPTICKLNSCGAEIVANPSTSYVQVPKDKLPSNHEDGIPWLSFTFTPVAPYEDIENFNFYVAVFVNQQEAVYPGVTPVNSSNLIFYIILSGVIIVLLVGLLIVVSILLLLIIREIRARKRANKRKSSNLDNMMASSKPKKKKFIEKFVHSRKDYPSEHDALIDRTLLSKFGSND